MKWYKHISDSLDDPFVFDLMTEFGAEGYLVFFGTLEIYSREFQPKNGWKLSITPAYFRQKLRISWKKSQKILTKITKWEVSYIDGKVIIFIPKFTELLDEWTQRKLGSDSGVTPKILGTDKDKDKDKDKPPIIPLTGDGEGKDENKKGAGSPFRKPSLDEIKAYCAERGNIVDPQTWLNHYTSNGWKVGKNKMVDWRAAVRTWEASRKNMNKNGGIIIKA